MGFEHAGVKVEESSAMLFWDVELCTDLLDLVTGLSKIVSEVRLDWLLLQLHGVGDEGSEGAPT